jgi:hypothetical protein
MPQATWGRLFQRDIGPLDASRAPGARSMYDRRMRAIIYSALLFTGCSSLTVQTDNTPETPQVYFSRNVEPLLVATCTTNSGGCHADDSHAMDFSYAALSQDLDDNFSFISNALLLNTPDQLHRAMAWTVDARASIQTWLQLESAARGN